MCAAWLVVFALLALAAGASPDCATDNGILADLFTQGTARRAPGRQTWHDAIIANQIPRDCGSRQMCACVQKASGPLFARVHGEAACLIEAVVRDCTLVTVWFGATGGRAHGSTFTWQKDKEALIDTCPSQRLHDCYLQPLSTCTPDLLSHSADLGIAETDPGPLDPLSHPKGSDASIIPTRRDVFVIPEGPDSPHPAQHTASMQAFDPHTASTQAFDLHTSLRSKAQAFDPRHANVHVFSVGLGLSPRTKAILEATCGVRGVLAILSEATAFVLRPRPLLVEYVSRVATWLGLGTCPHQTPVNESIGGEGSLGIDKAGEGQGGAKEGEGWTEGNEGEGQVVGQGGGKRKLLEEGQRAGQSWEGHTEAHKGGLDDLDKGQAGGQKDGLDVEPGRSEGGTKGQKGGLYREPGEKEGHKDRRRQRDKAGPQDKDRGQAKAADPSLPARFGRLADALVPVLGFQVAHVVADDPHAVHSFARVFRGTTMSLNASLVAFRPPAPFGPAPMRSSGRGLLQDDGTAVTDSHTGGESDDGDNQDGSFSGAVHGGPFEGMRGPSRWEDSSSAGERGHREALRAITKYYHRKKQRGEVPVDQAALLLAETILLAQGGTLAGASASPQHQAAAELMAMMTWPPRVFDLHNDVLAGDGVPDGRRPHGSWSSLVQDRSREAEDVRQFFSVLAGLEEDARIKLFAQRYPTVFYEHREPSFQAR
eukprot:jgi/Mesvir1/19348/Mv10402-RA.1